MCELIGDTLAKVNSARKAPPQHIVFRDIKYTLHAILDNNHSADKECDSLRKNGFRVRRQIKYGINLIYKSRRA